MSYFKKFVNSGLINPPKFINNDSVVFESLVGSNGYGTNNDKSDIDLYNVFIPTREMVFPYEYGYLKGFGKQPVDCAQHQTGKVIYKGKEHEMTIYNIVRFFDLCMECNPNLIEFMFADESSITKQVGCTKLFRDNRFLFLHKGFYKKFISYAQSQLNKMQTNKRTGKRKELYDLYNFDTKFSSHTLRLVFEAEQILKYGELRLKENSTLLKSVRNGEVPVEDIKKIFAEKKEKCDILFVNSKLQSYPNEEMIKELLLTCLETHWRKDDRTIDTRRTCL